MAAGARETASPKRDSTGVVKLTKVPVAVGDRINFIADPMDHGGNDTLTLQARITACGGPKRNWDVATDWTTDPEQNTERPSDVTKRDGRYTLMTRNAFYDSLWNIGRVPPRFWNVGPDRGPFTWKNESDGDVRISGPTGVRVTPGTVV